MKKRMWMGVLLLAVLVSVPAMAATVTTDQCWSFTDQPYDNSYAVADKGYENLYGKPTVTISDMSLQQDMTWNQEGFMTGSAFKLIFDIPNYPETENRYKELTLQMVYQGEIDFLWIVDSVSGDKFQQITQNPIIMEDGWKVYEQDFRFDRYNPVEEFVVIGLKGLTAPAAIDLVCITTDCVPEPATMVLLAVGGACVMRRKRQ